MNAYPIPVVIGLPGSGAEYLWAMLSSHPDLAIPFHSGYWETLLEPACQIPETAQQWCEFLESSSIRMNLGIDRDEIQKHISSLSNLSVGNVYQQILYSYAKNFHKPRVGEFLFLPCKAQREISRHIPEACFINVQRDGRDVFVDRQRLDFIPQCGVQEGASAWRAWLEEIKKLEDDGQRVLTVRFEDLVKIPVSVMESVCEFLELPFEPDMIRVSEGVRDKVRAVSEFRCGEKVLSGTDLEPYFAGVEEPLDHDCIGRWRYSLDPKAIRQYEVEVYGKLTSLGYLSKSGFYGPPNFLIAGPPKTGTTSLAEALSGNSLVAYPELKEVHFFNNLCAYERGLLWYQQFFWRESSDQLSFDATPTYFYLPDVAHRVKELLPDLKIVCLLRDPIKRFVSHYTHLRAINFICHSPTMRAKFIKDREWTSDSHLDTWLRDNESWEGESRSMKEVVEQYFELPDKDFTYFSAGKYAEHLRHWCEVIGEDQVYYIVSDDLFSNPRKELDKLQRFLGLPEEPIELPVEPLNSSADWIQYCESNPADELDDKLLKALKDYYRPHNEELFKLIDRKLDWI